MDRNGMYFPHGFKVFMILVLLLVTVVALIFVGVVGVAFRDVGFSASTTVLILVATFAGSYVNIPLAKLRATVPMIREEYVSFFGLTYRIPHLEYGETVTVLAVNVGGALIPAGVSLYLLAKSPSALLYCFIGILGVAIVTRAVSRPVKGVGIVTPAFVPPLTAAALALLLPSGAPKVVAYTAGVLGTLIGADLSNLNVIPELGAPMASIGGAGTFDGVFLSGIIAVLLA
jgi:uncharacterized membrane protein